MKKLFENKKSMMITLIGVAVIFAIVAVVVHFATQVTNDSYKNCAVGDVDGNGYINSADALLIEKHVKNGEELFDTQKTNGDVNLDGKLDETDIDLIQKYATGQIKKLPLTSDDEKAENGSNTAAEYENEDIRTIVTVENKWSNGDGTYSYQLKVSIQNSDNSRYRNWETTIAFGEGAQVTKNWDCDCTTDGNSVVIEGESIPSESTFNCGVIVRASANLKIESVITEN